METEIRPDAGLALAAEVLELLARLFWGPARADCDALLRADLPELTPAADVLPEAAGRALSALAREAAALPCAELEPLYVALFVSRPGGVPAPPYESCWEAGGRGRGRLMGPAAQRMRSRIEAAGLVLDEEFAEPPDHLCLELELLTHHIDSWLACGDPAELTAASRLAAHMRAWTGDFRDALAAQPGAGIFARAADLLTALLDHVAAAVPAD